MGCKKFKSRLCSLGHIRGFDRQWYADVLLHPAKNRMQKVEDLGVRAAYPRNQASMVGNREYTKVIRSTIPAATPRFRTLDARIWRLWITLLCWEIILRFAWASRKRFTISKHSAVDDSSTLIKPRIAAPFGNLEIGNWQLCCFGLHWASNLEAKIISRTQVDFQNTNSMRFWK